MTCSLIRAQSFTVYDVRFTMIAVMLKCNLFW